MTFFHSALYASFQKEAVDLDKNIDDLLQSIDKCHTTNELTKTYSENLKIRNSCFNVMVGLKKILGPSINKDLSAMAIFNSLVQEVLKLNKDKLILIKKSIDTINQYSFPDENLSNLLINHLAYNCFTKNELFEIFAKDQYVNNVHSDYNSYSKLFLKRGIHFQSKEKRLFVEDMNKSLLDRGGANDVYLANCYGSECILRIPQVPFSKHFRDEIYREIILKEQAINNPELLDHFVVFNTLFGEKGQNINKLSDFSQNEMVFGTYPLMSGGNLDFYIKKNQIISKNKLFSIAQQLILGLNILHKAKLAHRDIKPQNILFEDKTYSKVKYIDFGEMFLGDGDPHSERLCGTAYYQPPELFDNYKGYQYNLELAQKHDVYSLGLILYQLTFGHLPNHITSAPFMFRIGKAHIDFYKSLDPIYHIEQLSQIKSINDLIYWSINPDPQNRPTAKLMLNALKKIKNRTLKYKNYFGNISIRNLNFDNVHPSDLKRSSCPIPFRQFDENYKKVVEELKIVLPNRIKSISDSCILQNTTKTEVRPLRPRPVPQKVFVKRNLSSEKKLTLVKELRIVQKEKRKSSEY